MPTGDSDPSRLDPDDENVPVEVAGRSPGSGHGAAPVFAFPERPKRRHRLLAVVSSVAVLLVAAGSLIRLPYYTESPGSVRETERRISVSGRPSFDSDGEVFFTTVSQRQATPFDLLRAWMDDTIDVDSRADLFPKGDVEAVRVLNRKMMEDSKFNATVAALDELHIPVTVAGDGVFVDGLLPKSGATDKISQGDVIISVDGKPVTNASELSELMEPRKVGDTVAVGIRKPSGDDGTNPDSSAARRETVSVTLVGNEQAPGRGFLGVAVETSNPRLEMAFTLDIDSGEVGGPSAGLAWALGIVDRLTPGELTGGKKVAVTGTIDADGAVGPIGGITQKVAAVKREGITEFLYPSSTPADEVARMTKVADGSVSLHPVSTLQEALSVLAPDGVPSPPG